MLTSHITKSFIQLTSQPITVCHSKSMQKIMLMQVKRFSSCQASKKKKKGKCDLSDFDYGMVVAAIMVWLEYFRYF